MNNRRSRIPKHCLHKTSGRGFVRLDGRMVYTGRYGTEEAEQAYRRALAAWLKGHSVEPEPTPTDSTDPFLVEDLIAAYWVHAQAFYQVNGKATKELANIRLASQRLRATFGKTPVHEFGPRRLKELQVELIQYKLARTTINTYIGIAKRMFIWGACEELVPGEKAASLKLVPGLRRGRSPAKEMPAITPVSEVDFRATLPHLGRQVAAMAELQWLTGMRPGEVVQMRWGDIDRSSADGVWRYRPSQHKTQHHGIDRVIPLGPKAQDVLSRFSGQDGDKAVFSPAKAEKEHRASRQAARKSKVQPSQRERHEAAMANPRREFGATYTTESYGRAIRRACEAHGIQPWSPNQLRHAAATRIRRTHGLEAARVLLGHTSAATTEIYAEADQAKATQIMKEAG